MKHTPGPWKVGEDDAFVYALNAHGSNRFFAGVQAGWTAGEAVEGRTEHDELMANARLIAAAPDMLAALMEIAKGQGAFSRDPMEHAINTIADMKALAVEAIKKASGTS